MFDADGWLTNLEARSRLLNLPISANYIERAERLLLRPILPARNIQRHPAPTYIADEMPPDPAAWLGSRVTVTVDLCAPADSLKRQFARWVREARKARGLIAVNRAFERRDFERWHALRVLPYLDLRIWERACIGRLTYETMGDALFPDDLDTSVAGRVRKSVKPLADALVQPASIAHLRSLCC